MKAVSLSRKFWILFSTIFIVAAVFGFYFFVYVVAREGELREKKFRTLEQYAINITESYKESSKKLFEGYQALYVQRAIDISEVNAINSRIAGELSKAKQQVVQRLASDQTFDEILVEVDSNIIFQTFQNILDKEDLTSILKKDTNFSNNRFGTFSINDRQYLLFVHQFRFQSNAVDNELWRIYGFSLKENFQQQTRAVELIVVLIIALVLIVILISMPLLKLLVMNELEKLKIMNIWFTGFSVIVGSSFIVLTLLIANDLIDNLHLDKADQSDETKGDLFDRDERLEAISDAIRTKFSEELRLVYNQLNSARSDSSILRGLEVPRKRGEILNDSLAKYFSTYKFFNEILWISADGSQHAMLATHSIDLNDPDLNLNLGERKYFSWVLKDSTWKLPDVSPSSEEEISLQSIHSYRSGNHEAGIGIPWGNGVLAIATRLTSVMDPLMPPGYQFCIFDRTGKIWFHSTTAKNLQENFLNETNHPGKLKAAMSGRVSVALDLKYENKNVRVRLTPIPNMDLFLVTMHQGEYYHSPIVLTSGFALVLIFLMLLIQGIHQVIIYVGSVRYSQLKIRIFFLDWMRPKTGYALRYEKSAAAQLVLLVVLGLMANFIGERFFVICILALPVYLTTYHYVLFEGWKIFHAHKEVSHREFLRQPIFIASVCFLLLINMIGLHYLEWDNAIWIIVTQVLIGGWLAYSLSKSFEEFYTSLRGNVPGMSGWMWRRLHVRVNYSPYVMCLYVWLLLVAVLPAYYFYKVGYYDEVSAWTRHVQLEAARAAEAREVMLENKLSDAFGKDTKEIISKGNYLEATTEIKSVSSLAGFDTIPNARFYRLIFQGSPVISGQVELSRDAIFPLSSDRKWFWMESDHMKSGLQYYTAKGDKKFYSSPHEHYRFLKGSYWIISLVVLIVGIGGVYKILQFCIKHIFGVGLLRIGSQKEISIAPGVRYFIVGLPYSGKNKIIEKIKNNFDPDKVKVIDLQTDKYIAFPEKASFIILKHFEFGINDHNTNADKLNILMRLRDLPHVGVICLSNIEPQSILEFYEKQAAYYSMEKKDRELEGLYRKCNQALRNWKNVLSGYKVHYKALLQGHVLADSRKADELDHGEFLPTLEPYVNLGTGSTMENEEAVLQIEEMSQAYYHSLWNSFCNTEKFILYDLAKDGFVNMRNMKIIRILRQKGVIQFKDSLKIMNASFNNFILSVINEDEEMKMEHEMRAKGSWNTLHLVLVITIISIIVFLGIAQKELFKNFEAILAAVVTLLPLLARFSGIFGSKSKE